KPKLCLAVGGAAAGVWCVYVCVCGRQRFCACSGKASDVLTRGYVMLVYVKPDHPLTWRNTSPLSGGVGAARAGNLTFMVGGVEQEFDAAKELLTCMGTNVVYCGEVGTGQAAKICNNMLLAISMIGTAEAMNLGIRLGLDPKLLAKILNMSSGRCWSSDTYNPVPGVMEGVPSANNYQGGFGTTLMAKDLGLAQISATNTKTPVPLGSQAHQIYRMMCAKGYALKDFSAVFQFLREEETL
ncbi:PREDICTED: 3-hydroxyisobutyrate dehydrogenase, mitochondrial-like, partial [Merops nubicus]|uniref:3-hydroxyisobutyrate dehydrogenase, mitochondrial-like n=1 Tax=Merops nubicus TaxID=57421 RepID=UPI0004F025BB